jgi:hypothetical protein
LLALFGLNLHAFNVSVTRFVCFAFAISSQPDFSAFSNVFLVTFSLLGSAEINDTSNTFWWNNVLSTMFSFNAMSSFFSIASFEIFAIFFCIAKKFCSLAACSGMADVFFAKKDFFFNAFFANLGFAGG